MLFPWTRNFTFIAQYWFVSETDNKLIASYTIELKEIMYKTLLYPGYFPQIRSYTPFINSKICIPDSGSTDGLFKGKA